MSRQQSLGFELTVPQHVYEYGDRATGETHGVVLTKPHIVRLILDLAKYTSDRNLTKLRLLEPSCGEGVFLIEAVGRLLASAKRHRVPAVRLGDSIRAYDIDETSVARTKATIGSLLVESGVDRVSTESLVGQWIHRTDFLLAPIVGSFDVIVGNPPYVRIEQLDPQLQAIYRGRFETIFDRADLYVAFIERSLELLSATGLLSFICADRWTMNRYGAPLRSLIAREYGVRVYVDLHQASPFESDVIAYPSIFVFERRKPAHVVFAKLREGTADECAAVALSIDEASVVSTHDGVHIFRYERWFENDDPWVLGSPAQLAALRELEDRFATLQADGKTRVGIGVATGADEVFIVSGAAAQEVEPERLVPLVMRSDIREGRIEWGGHYVINTFTTNEGGIDLAEYPKLAAYFVKHDAAIRRRHVSQRSNGFWFRTIDRVYPDLVQRPKLLIPDIAGSNEVAYDAGKYHPHHNLYFVTSDSWDLEVLGGLLSSKLALFFVWSYAVKMRGGYLRFQAQYLRRIRVPDPASLSAKLKNRIQTAFRDRDFKTLDSLALEAYSLETLPEFSFVDTRK
ncbi:MAG TPA: Eco57I restriction-modification methylase domain-containing protein [Thermoanaerobaculia bacterium]|jgi:adenine-specific DNA-methyltransferase|nr:Eco57I restriction-modification methylase domain-containing protein [Thermoanaerobaculia bacterium]